MKKFLFLTVLIMITTVGFSNRYSYSYESVRYFSDREIANLLPSIKKVNPHIPDLNWIHPGEILNIPLDGTLVSIFIKEGDNTSKVLSCGIPEIRIAEAKIIHSNTKTSSGYHQNEKTLSAESTHVKKERASIPPEVRWSVVGIIAIFISLSSIYIFLKRQEKK